MENNNHKSDNDLQLIQQLVNLHQESAFPIDKETSSHNNGDHNQIEETNNLSIYRFESARRESFKNWPLSFIDQNVLASAGFYYTGITDRVRCFSCDIEISQWFEGDNPMFDHQRWSYNCKFVRNNSSGNIPIGFNEKTAEILSEESECSFESADGEVEAISREINKSTEIGFRPIDPTDSPQVNISTYSNASTSKSLTSTTVIRPNFHEFAVYDNRLNSFLSCSGSIYHIREELAFAGFFFTGIENQIRCYQCGIDFNDWKLENDPWKEHAKLSPDCYYVMIVKGQSYIEEIVEENPRIPNEEIYLSNKVQENEEFINQMTISSNDHMTENNYSEETASILETTQYDDQLQFTEIDRGILMCRICSIQERGILFLPCGHMVSCVKCASGISSCFICQENISSAVHTTIV